MTSSGTRFVLAAQSGLCTVVYFFPKAFTPGCTVETKSFRDNHVELEIAGAMVVGISTDNLATQFGGAHRTLSNKYYVDELYGATVIAGTFAGGRGLWTFDRKVVDGAVNGTGWLTVISSWFSGLTDRTVVDGLVNLVGWTVQESSLLFRRVQTGLVQNYALMMLFGVFAFVSIYLLVR